MWKFGEITGEAEHYLLIIPIGTTALESVATIYLNKAIYKVWHIKQFNNLNN